MTSKQFGFVKRFKKYVIEDLVHDSLQEYSSCQRFKYPGNEDQGKSLEDEHEHDLEDEKMKKTLDLNPEEDISSIEKKHNSKMCIGNLNYSLFCSWFEG